MSNRLFRHTGLVIQQVEIVTTNTVWVDDPVESVVPPVTPPIVSVDPPLDNPISVPWVGMGLIPCITSGGQSGQMMVQYLPDGRIVSASNCLLSEGVAG